MKFPISVSCRGRKCILSCIHPQNTFHLAKLKPHTQYLLTPWDTHLQPLATTLLL